jgi:hypothetical protein
MAGRRWREIFTSDAKQYGGDGVSNEGELQAQDESLKVRLPPRGFVVLRQLPQG